MTIERLKQMRAKEIRCCIIGLILSLLSIGIASADFTVITGYEPSTLTLTYGGVTQNLPIKIGYSVNEFVNAALLASGTDSNGQECKFDNLTWSILAYNDAVSSDGGNTFNSTSGKEALSVTGSTVPFDISLTPDTSGYWKVYVKFKAHFHSTSGDQSNGGWQDQYGTATVYFAVAVGDFTFTLNPTNLSVLQGDYAITTAGATSLNNFKGEVDYTVPPLFQPGSAIGVTAIGSVTLSPNSSQGAPVTVNVPSTVPPSGTIAYPIFIRGTAKSLSILVHDQPLNLMVYQGIQITSKYDTSNASSKSTSATPSVAVPNIRQADGSMVTDSVLAWNDTYKVWVADHQQWSNSSPVDAYSGGPYYASPNNSQLAFDSYSWTSDYSLSQGPSGGDHTTEGYSTFLPGPHGGTSNSVLVNPSGPGGTETLTLNASLHNKSYKNTYKINWHFPAENFRFISSDLPPVYSQFTEPAYYTDANHNTTTNMTPGVNAEFPIDPERKDIYDNGSLELSVFMGGSSAGVAWPDLFESLGVGSGPEGWIVAGSLAAAGAYSGSLTSPAPTPNPNPLGSSYAQYVNDVTNEYNFPQGSPLGVHHFEPNSLLTKAYNEIQTIQGLYGINADGTQDLYYSSQKGTMKFTGFAGQNTRKDHFIGDAFGSSGFTGPVYRDVSKRVLILYELDWHFTPNGN